MIFTISHRSNACVQSEQRLVIGLTFSFLPLLSFFPLFRSSSIPALPMQFTADLLRRCVSARTRKRGRSRVIFCEISHDRGSNVNRSLKRTGGRGRRILLLQLYFSERGTVRLFFFFSLSPSPRGRGELARTRVAPINNAVRGRYTSW